MNGFGKRFGGGRKGVNVALIMPSRNALVLKVGILDIAIKIDRHDETIVRKFLKVKPGTSLYDGNLLHFAERLSYQHLRTKNLRSLLKKKNFSCAQCDLVFSPTDIIELHHVLDKKW